MHTGLCTFIEIEQDAMDAAEMVNDSRPSALKRKQENTAESPPRTTAAAAAAASDVLPEKLQPTDDEIKSPTENNNVESKTVTGIRDQEDRDPLPYTAAVASVDTETVDDSKPSALKRERKFSESSPPRTAAKVRSERLKPTADGIELATGKNKMLFESVKDKFGCVELNGDRVFLQYILRVVNDVHVRFVSARDAETTLLAKYLKFLHPDVINMCAHVEAYVMTPDEASLMNVVNRKHSNEEHGIEFVVSVDEMFEFYDFLKVCYGNIKCDATAAAAAATLDRDSSSSSSLLGFIRVGGSNALVPYTTIGDRKYLPLLFFDGNTELLLDRAVKMEKWHLAYVKFCLYVMGVRETLYAGKSCLMAVTLDELKRHFPSETVFDVVRWPDRLVDTKHLINDGKSAVHCPIPFWIKPAANGSLSAACVTPVAVGDNERQGNSIPIIDLALLQQQDLNGGCENDGHDRSQSSPTIRTTSVVTRTSTTSVGSDVAGSVANRKYRTGSKSDDDVPRLQTPHKA